ncbi:MAG TPA: hypothetical protein VHV50_04645 [Actinomycetota bacterium]|nr:hypothetical protein [Actinomycetota bacterium]
MLTLPVTEAPSSGEVIVATELSTARPAIADSIGVITNTAAIRGANPLVNALPPTRRPGGRIFLGGAAGRELFIGWGSWFIEEGVPLPSAARASH